MALTLFISCNYVIKVQAETLPLTNIFSYEDYLNEDYSSYSNQSITGKYYKVGLYGHHMVVNYGDVSLKAHKIEDLYPNTAIGTVSSVEIKTTQTYTVTNKTTASQQVKVGITEMVEASIKFKDVASVGGSTSFTPEYTFGIEKMFSETLTKDYSITSKFNLAKIPADKTTFSISRVAIFLEFEIKSSYTEEHTFKLFQGYYWKKLINTEIKDYKSSHYIGDLVTFCYNDGTFGNTEIGLYKLQTIKKF